MEWPYRRFLKAFDAFQRRVMCDEWRARKVAHIMALNANSGFADDKESGTTRQGVLDDLERTYDEIVANIWNGTVGKKDEAEEEVWNSPLMRAGRRAVASIQPPTLPGQAEIESLPAA